MKRLLPVLPFVLVASACLDFEAAREDCLARGDCLGSLIPPTLTETTPANQATDVAVNSDLRVTFSREMDVGSVVVVVAPPAALGSRLWNEEQTAFQVEPTSPLAFDTEYSVTLTGRAKDGVPLGEDARFSFRTTTAPDEQAPTLVATSPQSGAMNVAHNFRLVLTFSEAMRPDSVTVAAQPAYDFGVPSWSADGHTATFATPPADFTASTDYAVQVDGEDLAGNALTGLKAFSFGTQGPLDTTPPEVTGSSPLDGAMDVLPSDSPSVTFSEPMNASTVSTAFTISPPLSGGCSVLPDATGTVFTCQHAQPLSENTQYTVTVGTGAQDGAGNGLASPFSFSFTTGSPPKIVSTVPSNGALGVARNTQITVTFSEAMDQQATASAFSITQPVAAGGGTITWDATGTVMTYSLPSGYTLPYGTDVEFQIGTGARDLTQNPLAQATTSTFRAIRHTVGHVITADSSGGYDDGHSDSILADTNAMVLKAGNSGTNGGNHHLRAMLSFDLSGLKSNLQATALTSATLTVRQSGTLGTPYGSYAQMYLFGIHWTTTGPAGGYSASEICTLSFQACMSIGACRGLPLSTSAAPQDLTLSVLAFANVGFNSTSQRASFRIERRNKTPMIVGCPEYSPADTDGAEDSALFVSAESATNKPTLTVSFEHP